MADSTVPIPEGFCQCGCGNLTAIAQKNNTRWGYVKGKPKRFLKGHNAVLNQGSNHPRWRGGVSKRGRGYVFIWYPSHPRASRGYVQEHILVAEEVLGKPLPPKTVVHHVNGDIADNRKENLVICENQAYHLLLHRRKRYAEYRAKGLSHHDFKV